MAELNKIYSDYLIQIHEIDEKAKITVIDKECLLEELDDKENMLTVKTKEELDVETKKVPREVAEEKFQEQKKQEEEEKTKKGEEGDKEEATMETMSSSPENDEKNNLKKIAKGEGIL